VKKHIQARTFTWRIHWGQFWDRIRFVVSRDWMEAAFYLIICTGLAAWFCMIFEIWG